MKALGIFVKQPVAGTVKTRLAADIGADEAASLYSAFLEDTVAKYSNVADRRIVGYAPATADSETYFHNLVGDAFELWPQPDCDLGGRMAAFFANHLSDGTTNVVLIGSDTPLLPVELVLRAYEVLEERDCVIGPATDGGYYLIGLRQAERTLFEAVEWSSSRVLEQTCRAISTAGLTLGLLPPWYDVDTLSDLVVLRSHLDAMLTAGERVDAPHLLQWPEWDTLRERSIL